MKIYRYLPLLFGFILLFCTACTGTSINPTLAPAPASNATAISPATQTPAPLPTATLIKTTTPSSTPGPTALPLYGLGQLVLVKDLELAVFKVSYANQQLWVTLAAHNNGPTVQIIKKEQFHIFQSGKPAVQNACDTTPPSFNDQLQPGDILSGTICWKSTAAESTTRLEYQDQNNQVLAAWEISKPGEAAVPAGIVTPHLNNPLHKPGEAALYKGATVSWVLIKITTIGSATYVKTLFTYENKGASVVTLPMNLLSDLEIKTANGEIMWQALIDRDCHIPYTEDIVLPPGKNLQVTVCFGTLGASPQPGGRIILMNGSTADQPDFFNWTIK
jgi:hypothetical protein